MANRWTEEQLDAINLEGNNIIVSAGAGSGKTAVLSERVLRKVKSGIHVDELLILTFTNAAAKEMKDRIRNKLKDENYLDEVALIDNAFITTFDSFSLSIVKKYHTILNISKEIGITDSSLLNIEKNRIIDEIFDKYYKEENSLFEKLISDFCFKDDKELKRLILKLNDKLDNRYDKNKYLNNYIEKHFSEEKINIDINIYFNEIKKLIDKTKDLVHDLSHYTEGTFISSMEDKLTKLFNVKDYNDLYNSLDFRLPPLKKDMEEEAKVIKENISTVIKEIKELVIYKDKEEIKEEILSTKDNVSMILRILTEFDNEYLKYKNENNMYSFSDISRMAIEIVENNENIREEIKNSFQEIMIDEYQDTNDIQEYFISFISKNNVYMVGDIKQSIYRFRNANPYIFKSKYDNYSNNNNGIKIDLLKNFRSREEVLNNINLLFDDLMDDDLGGADYKKSHRMIFGNKTYNEEGSTNQEYDFSILSYEEDKAFSNNEKEMFIIGNDILNKINNKYKVFDKDKKILRNIMYSDFVILLDRTTDFNNYKKVFEYLHIPLTLYKDEELKNDKDILVIRNLLKLIRCIDNEEYNEEFKYLFTSIARSFLFEKKDQEIFDYFKNDSFMESDIYKLLLEAYEYFYELSPKAFFLKLCDIFNYYEKLLLIGNVKIGRVRIEYFYNLLNDFESNGKDINSFIDYLDSIFDSDEKVSFSLNNSNSNSVKIMTIHKSKGLEYHICYFAGFSKSFSFRELNDNILYSNKYGIITPYFNEYIKPTIYKTLLKLDNKREEISEKIRLLYVALTRAKEKMIIVIPKLEEDISIDKYKVKSFLDMMKYVYKNVLTYVEDVDIECTKDYLISKNDDEFEIEKNEPSIKVDELYFDNIVKNEEKYSKNKISIITKEEREKMNYGIKVHEVLEKIDFNNPKYDNIDSFVKRKVERFLDNKIIKNNLDNKFYKEYEFIYEKDNNIMHGIIDLMIENDDEIIIIDYKLKNIDDEAYNKQLLGYKSAISKRSRKKIIIYLYSIVDEEFIEI